MGHFRDVKISLNGVYNRLPSHFLNFYSKENAVSQQPVVQVYLLEDLTLVFKSLSLYSYIKIKYP